MNIKATSYFKDQKKDQLYFQDWVNRLEVFNRRKYLANLEEIKIFENVGHGIETYPGAIKYIGDRI